MSVLRKEYPRPQLVRPDWVNLNGEWDFAFDDHNAGLKQQWHRHFPEERQKINVPFAYQSKLSGIHDHTFHDVVWYSRSLDIPSKWKGKQIHLHFGAVDYRSWVYVNGQLAVFHEGGNTPFSADITHLLEDRENMLTVRVEDPSEDVTIPRGKQYWHEKSESIFYTRTTGIWQTVWMEAVEETHIGRIRWTPEIDRGDIELELDTHGFRRELTLQVDISFKGQKIVSDSVLLLEP
ncbi:MAG TPA: sugar-binding domain-containing protein, partial [Bacillaceae bacterium]